MKKLYSLICFLFAVINITAQTTEDFETESHGLSSFTNNSQVFNITSQAQGPFDIQGNYPGTGWNGTSADNRYIDNDGFAIFNTPVQFAIAANGGTDFQLKSMYLFLSTHALDLNVSGSVTITGRRDGATQFTATASSPFNTSMGVNNGFTFINMLNYGGSNNSNTNIDEFIITTTGNISYVAMDAMSWQTVVACTTISSTGAQTNVSCNGGSNGTATVTPTSGTAPYTYAWSPSGGTASTASGLLAGSYTVTITDANGCTGTRNFTITQPAAPLAATGGFKVDPTCNGGSNGSATVFVTGGTTPYTYSWSPSGGTAATGTGLSAGTYTVTVTDSKGCTATRNFTITQPLVLATTGSQTDVSCNGGTNGTATVIASGGTAPYIYSWSPSGGTGATASGLAAGSYTVTVTDSKSCTTTKNYTINQPATVSGSTVVTNASCGSNGAINLIPSGGTAPYTFDWGSGITTEDRTGLTAGNYSVTITDSNGCTGTVNTTVSSAGGPSGSTMVSNVSCFGGANGAIVLTSSGGTPPYTYSWNDGPTSKNRSGLSAGTYTVTITDANGCQATVVSNVTQALSPLSGITVVTNVACNGGSNGAINLTPSGGTPPYTYNWGGGITTEDRTGLTAGTYSVTITDANACTATIPITVTQPVAAVSGSTIVTNLACNGGSTGAINLTPSGGTPPYTFSWGGGITTEDRTGLTAGSYSVTITDANGCTSTINATVTQPAFLSAFAMMQNNVACNGGTTGSATVGVTGGTGAYTYSWSPSGGTGATASGLSAGTYTVTVTDANGCTDTQSFTITQTFTSVSGSTVVTNVACNGGSNGAINLTPSGGSGPYTFNWGGGIATEDRTGLSAGTYTVIITDVNGCTATVNATVTQPASPLSGTTVVTNVACFGGTNGTINLTPSGGTPPYTYNWGGGITTQDRTGLAAGTYSVTITDAFGCTGVVNATVTQPASSVAGTTVVTNVSCNGSSTGAVNLTPTGGTPPYTFNWGGGITTEDRAGIAAGSYSVTITDANGCTGTVNATITQPASLSVVPVSQTNIACNGGSNGSAAVNVTGGTGPYTYSWSPSGGTGASAFGLGAGTYTVTVTDANGCVGTQSFTITQPPAFTISTSQTNISCNGGANGTASVTVSGGTGPYTYSWAPSGGTGATATGLAAGNYLVTITDANGCSTVRSFTITQPVAMSAATSQTNVLCNGGATGTASVNVSGGTLPYTYVWSPSGGTAATATGLSVGNYSVTATDANGCTITRNFTITQPAALTATTSQSNATCVSPGQAAVTPSGGAGGYTYLWSPSGHTTQLATGLAAGNHSVIITDANGCTITRNFTITTTNTLAATTSQTNVSCNGGSNGTATVVASGAPGPYTYSWAPSGGTGATATGLSAGNYVVTITSSNGCSITKNFTITQPATSVSGNTVVTNLSCFGDSNGAINLTPSGGTAPYTFDWGGGITTEDRTGLTAGTYTVVITDAIGCTGTVTATVTQPTVLNPVLTAHSNVSCNGGSNGSATVTVTGGTGGYTYSWSPSGGTGATASGLAAGPYWVSITDANGCTAMLAFSISDPAALIATAGAQTNVSCNGGSNGSATVAVTGGTGGYTYSWAPSGGTGATASGLSAGAYTVTVTDANGCQTTQSFTITQPSALAATASAQTNIACNGASTGSATVAVTGGTGAYTYSWAPSGGTAATASGLLAGTYTVTVTDANGCTATQSFTITQPAALVATAGIQTNVSCNGGSNGTATVAVTGGTGGYTYSWAPSGGTGATASGLSAGTYTVTVTDANGCTATQSFTITQPAGLVATASQTNVSCNGGSNGTATVAVTGGTGAYTYSWAPSGGTGATASGLAAGTYTVTVTDANACQTTQSFTITQPAALVATASAQTNVSCNGGSNGSATVAVTGGTGAYTYSWAPSGGTVATASGLSAGTYTVTVTDANGCTATQSFIITEPAALVAAASAQTNIACNGASTGSATVAVTGGTGAYTYLWAPSGGTAATASGLAAGTYTVTVTDANGCTATQSFIITQPAALMATASAQTNVSCNGGSNGTATVAATGGTGAYTYSWAPSGGTAATASGLAAGIYTVTVTDANGCTATQSFTITQPAALAATASAQINVSCNGSSNGSATVAVTGGTGAYTYSWAPSGGTGATASGLAAGTYTVTVTDANGCTTTQSFTITQPAVLVATSGAQTNVSCNGGSNGTATVAVTGGTGAYTYSWAPSGGTGATATGLAAGTYTVTVTDANGCTATQLFTITQPAALVATLTTTNVGCPGAADGTASVAVTGGTGAYTYSWAPSGGTAATATGLTAGAYTVTVTDANGCTVVQSINVLTTPDVTAPVADVTNLPAITNYCAVLTSEIAIPTATDNCNGTITATTTNPLEYTTEGTYTITWNYDDGNGNTSSQTQTINVLASPLDPVTFDDATFIYNTSVQTIEVANLPAGATVNYSTAPVTGTDNGAVNAGTYTVTATVTPPAAAFNCDPITLTATLTIERAPQVIIFDPLAVMNLESDPDFQLGATATSGLPVYYTYTYTSPQPPATVTQGGFVDMLTSGEVLITAHQDGNENYLPAASVEQILIIESSNASISAITVGDQQYDNPSGEIYYLIDCADSSDSVEVNIVTEVNATVVPGHQFTINTPAPGIYSQEVTVTSQDGTVTNTYTIVVEKRFNFFDIVVQKFDNVLLVNNNPATNGGYQFVAYEWYRNNQLIGIGQYYSAGDDITDLLNPTADYYVSMTTVDGEVLQTCIAQVELEHFASRLYPNPAIAGRSITVETDFPQQELEQMRISVYSLTGSLVTTLRSSSRVTEVQLPATIEDATYLVLLETPNIKKTLKVIVRK
jgi:hypothetical protein